MTIHCSSHFLPLFPSIPRPLPRQKSSIWIPFISNKNYRNFIIPPLVSASSAYYSDDLSSRNSSHRRRFQSPKKSILTSLIHEIVPLDVSLIQKDVPPATVDATKRIISGMLGILPSDQFQVLIEALWEPLSKLLVSSMMTGYTLRNAEYRLCLERNLDINEENSEKKKTLENSPLNVQGMFCEGANIMEPRAKDELSSESEKVIEEPSDDNDIQGLGKISSEAEHYIRHLELQLSSIKKDLHEVKRRSAALQMQQFVGEEKNDLLDYLRSLQPEKERRRPRARSHSLNVDRPIKGSTDQIRACSSSPTKESGYVNLPSRGSACQWAPPVAQTGVRVGPTYRLRRFTRGASLTVGSLERSRLKRVEPSCRALNRSCSNRV